MSAICGDLKMNSAEIVAFGYAPKVQENIGKNTLELQVNSLFLKSRLSSTFLLNYLNILCLNNPH